MLPLLPKPPPTPPPLFFPFFLVPVDAVGTLTVFKKCLIRRVYEILTMSPPLTSPSSYHVFPPPFLTALSDAAPQVVVG